MKEQQITRVTVRNGFFRRSYNHCSVYVEVLKNGRWRINHQPKWICYLCIYNPLTEETLRIPPSWDTQFNLIKGILDVEELNDNEEFKRDPLGRSRNRCLIKKLRQYLAYLVSRMPEE